MLKPIVPGCLALVIRGPDTGKSVRVISLHHSGELVDLPNGDRRLFKPKIGVSGWLCIGDVSARTSSVSKEDSLKGFAMYHEKSLVRIDAEGDDDLIDEFGMEEYADVMAKQMGDEGVKRLW